MPLNGAAMEQVYLYLLVGGVGLLIIILLLGDILDAVTGHLDVLPFGPSEVVLFASFLGGVGLLFQKFIRLSLSSTNIFIASGIAALVFTFLLSYFLLRPLKNMESSSAVDLKDMVGRRGIITMEVKNGTDALGEVKVEHELGYIFRTAISRDGNALPVDTEVVVWEFKNNRFVVFPRTTTNETESFRR